MAVNDLLDDIRLVCARHGSESAIPEPNQIAGVADNVRSGAWPLNGMRHGTGSTSGWFLWAGTKWSDAADFFKPTHVAHLIECCPEVMPYLGLAPGFRFLIAPDYEDVWIDPELLQHDV